MSASFGLTLAQKGAPGGVADLDTDGFVPDAEIAAGITRDTELAAEAAARAAADTALSARVAVLEGVTGPFPAPYEHDQMVASATWTVTHNMGREPAAVSVIDSAGTVVLGGVQHIDSNSLRLLFSAPFAGKALVF